MAGLTQVSSLGGYKWCTCCQCAAALWRVRNHHGDLLAVMLKWSVSEGRGEVEVGEARVVEEEREEQSDLVHNPGTPPFRSRSYLVSDSLVSGAQYGLFE